MSILGRLATSIGRRDEVPNQELAVEIAASDDSRAVKVLVENLSNPNRNISSDCIKVLYEIGERKPRLIMRYVGDFGKLLDSKDNRLVWGGVTALDTICEVNPKGVHNLLREILAAGEGGSVIARDHAVRTLVKLASFKEYRGEALGLLLDQLRRCPDNQFPMYAEMSESAFGLADKKDLYKVLNARSKTLKKESQRKRVEKVLKRLA